MNITIDKPSLKDLPRILELWESQYDFHHKLDPEYYVLNSPALKQEFEKYLTSAIEKDTPYIIAAYNDKTLVGFMTFEKGKADYFDTNIKKFALFLEIYVDEKYRNQGVATQLMQKAENIMADMGYEWIEFQCSTFNTNAIKLYEQLGYQNKQSYF